MIDNKIEFDALIENILCGAVVLRIKDDHLCLSHVGGDKLAAVELEDMIGENDLALLLENAKKCVETREPFSQELRINGKEKWLEINGRYLERDSDGCDTLSCVLTDITDSFVVKKMRVKEEFYLRMLSDHIGGSFFDYDVDIDRISVKENKVTSGLKKSVYDGFIKEKLLKSYIHPDDVGTYYSTWNKALMLEDSGSVDYRTKIHDGEFRWYKMTYISVCKADGKVSNVYGMFSPIDHLDPSKAYLAKDQEEFERLSVTDLVTGLYNRNAFKRAASQIIKDQFNKEQCFALVYSDINDFSYINESLGYEAGDEVLRDFAQIICGCSIGLAGCRIYSDYFVSLYRASNRNEVINEISKNNMKFTLAQKDKYPHSNLTVSSGVYFITSAGEDMTAAIDNANLARRSIKGTNDIPCAVYAERMRKKRSHDQSIASEIWNAITSGAIELFLQPKFDLVTREVIGAEALTRWRNPDGSYKLPYEFIDVLEDVGYIIQLDMYIYEKVLQCLTSWKEQGRKLVPISVNFSRKHNSSSDFVNRVSSLADMYGVDTSLIELEITEGCFTKDVKNLFSNMRKLRERGFKIDIDDFGTGYSSLSVLIEAPVDIVKVDKVFIDDISNSERSRDYVKHISSLIKSTRKEIIFEGVETEEQAQILAESGHTMAQGWLFDKAIPAEDFTYKYL